jgi:prepilin-type processing-associated H-X9-DG protein
VNQPTRFTLIEVAIVIGVLLLLAALLLPVLRYGYERQCRKTCASYRKSIGLSLLMYSGDFDGYFPNANPIPTNNFEPLASQNYVQDGEVWSCPSRTTVMTLARNSACRYIGSGLKDDNKSATSVSLAYDQSGNHPSNAWCNVLFIDGHVSGGRPANSPALFAND